MIYLKTIIPLIALLVFAEVYTVNGEEKATEGIIGGVQYWDAPYVEAGYLFGRRINWIESNSIKAYGGLGICGEVGFPKDKDPVVGLKLSYTINMYISFGGSLIYYTDFSRWGLRFRPEFGISAFGVRLVYGRNSTMFKPDFNSLHTNTMSLTVFVPM